LNAKIKRVIGDIEKTKEKIAGHQSRLRELERLRTELENADIVAMVRSIDIPPAEFEAFARAFMEQKKNAAVPDSFSPASSRRPYAAAQDDDIDDKEDNDVEE